MCVPPAENNVRSLIHICFALTTTSLVPNECRSHRFAYIDRAAKKAKRENSTHPRVSSPLKKAGLCSWQERILIGASESYDLCSMCSIGGTGSLRSHSTWDPRRHMYEELSHYAPNRRCPPPPRMGSADGLPHRGW